MSGHLTVIDLDQQARIDATPLGTMGWIGGGPAGATCFECAHYARPEKPRNNELQRRCGKFARWYRAHHGVSRAPLLRISPQTQACSSYCGRSKVEVAE